MKPAPLDLQDVTTYLVSKQLLENAHHPGLPPTNTPPPPPRPPNSDIKTAVWGRLFSLVAHNQHRSPFPSPNIKLPMAEISSFLPYSSLPLFLPPSWVYRQQSGWGNSALPLQGNYFVLLEKRQFVNCFIKLLAGNNKQHFVSQWETWPLLIAARSAATDSEAS